MRSVLLKETDVNLSKKKLMLPESRARNVSQIIPILQLQQHIAFALARCRISETDVNQSKKKLMLWD